MKISNEFAVSTPIDRAWTLLTDLAGIAPCLPGAHLTGVAGDTYSGKVKVKVGPVVSDFAGTARFVEKDDEAHRAVIDAKGRDSRSAGNATALVTAQLRADGDRTLVNVETDLKISGKLAQFGSSIIKEVSAKLLGQFVTNLEAKLAAEQQPTAAETAPASAAVETATPSAPPAPAAASVDLSARNGVAPGALSAGPSAGLGAAADPSAGPDAATQPGGGSSTGSDVAVSSGGESSAGSGAAVSSGGESSAGSGAAVSSGGESSAGSGAAVPSGAGPESSAAPGARDGGAAAATSPGDWVRGDPHARVAPAVRGSAEPDTAEEPEPLDLLSLAGGTIYKRIIPVGIGAAAVAAAIIWYVARR